MEQLPENKKSYDLTIWLGIALSISFAIYVFFYTIAGYIRKLNRVIDPAELSPPLRAWYLLPRDGIEPWVLYILITGVVLLTVLFMGLENKWQPIKPFIYKVTKFALLPVLILTLIVRPPPTLSMVSGVGHTLLLLIAAVVVFFAFLKLFKYKKSLFFILLSVLMIPMCFIAIGPLSAFDYNFILDPALRLLHGYKLSEIYFQYDLFLSLLMTPFLAAHAEPNTIQYLFQFSYYAFLVGLLIFSSKIFTNKNLTVPLIMAVVVMRFFAIQYEPTYAFQLTPLRLDLWIIPLSLVWYFGVFHWVVGLAIGALIVSHRNFGTIYMVAYFACLFLHYAKTVYDVSLSKENFFEGFKLQTISFLKSCCPTVFFPVLAFVASMIIFKDTGISQAAKLYGSFGFGFDAINRSSYYWYTPALLSFVTILLFKLRKELTAQYFSTVLFLVFLVIGNSLYFYGRSHESNVIAISASIMFLLFIFIDLVASYLSISMPLDKFPSVKSIKEVVSYRFIVPLLPIFVVLCSVFYYSKNISTRIPLQITNFRTDNLYQNKTSKLDLEDIKKITAGSDKVYPMVFANDFHFYYYGQYNPVGYWFPYASWVFKKDQIQFLQGLLDDGYYLVYNLHEENYIDGQKEILAGLKFTQDTQSPPYGVIHK